jgi:hypothetical protein
VVEVRIEGRKLDVFEGFDFSFNYGIADIRNPEKRSTEYSKTIKCPATKNNDELFGHIYDVNISNNYDANTTNISVNFNPNKKAEARVIADGVEVMAGVVQLRKIVQKGHAYTYEVVFIGKLLNIFSVLGDKELNGVDENGNPYIDFSDLNHAYNYANITSSWNFTDDYVYPMLDNGTSFEYNGSGERIYGVTQFKPFLKLKSVINRIFDFAGFSYTSSFFNSALFERLIIGEVKENLLSDAQADLRNAEVTLTSPDVLDLTYLTFSALNGYTHRFDFTTVVYDAGNNIDINSDIYFTSFESVSTVTSVVDYEVTRVRQSFFSKSYNSNGDDVIYRYDILGNGNCDVYVHPSTTPFRTNEPTSQTLSQITGDTQAGGLIPNEPLVSIINQATTDESYRNYVALMFFGYDCIFGTNVLYPIFKHAIRRYDSVQGYVIENSTDFVLFPNMALGDTVNQTSYASAESVNINQSNYLFTELFIPINAFGNVWFSTPMLTYLFDEYEMEANGFFRVTAENNTLLEHQDVDFNSIVPIVEMSELFTSVLQMFNLYVEVDPNNERNLLIETRDTFYSQGGTKDWTYKLARDRDVTLEPLGVLTDREYIYTYSEDGDYYNERYQSNRGHVYGRARIEVDNDFVQSSKETEIIFSPTPLINDKPSSRIIGAIYDSNIEDGFKQTDSNVRILQWGGMLPSNPQWVFAYSNANQQNIPLLAAFNTYPYAGHWDNPITPTIDINFGLTYELYYQANAFTGTLQVTNANLYNIYHRNYINEVTDKDSKVMTAMFYLEPTDINTLDFRDQIVIDNSYWRLNKVMNYNPFKEGLTKVELIKIKEAVTFQKSDRSLNAGGYLGKEKMPSPSTEIKTNGNKYPPFQGKVSGAENNVGQSVTAFKVVGSRNTIGEGSKNITIFGNDNEVIGGLHNVQLINTNGVIVTQSNTTYINGKEQDNVEVLDGGENEVRALNGGTNIFTVDGGEDIVQTQFSEIAIYTIEGGEQ